MHSTPHFDLVYNSLPWPNSAKMNHSISFTLPIHLPPAGHGLKIYHAYHDAYNGVWKDYRLNEIPPISIQDAFRLDSHTHYYTPGTLTLHSGMELHCIPPFKAPPLSSGIVAYRITLQGWGVWLENEDAPGGTWNIFS